MKSTLVVKEMKDRKLKTTYRLTELPEVTGEFELKETSNPIRIVHL